MDRLGILREGYYESVEQLIEEMNAEMDVLKKANVIPPIIAIDPITRYVYIKPGKDEKKTLLPDLNDEIRGIFGLTDEIVLNDVTDQDDDDIITGERASDIDSWLHTLYVYCDIVAPQYVGNTRAKLLRAVEVPNNTKYGDQIVVRYENPHYVPLIVNDFEEIEINIKDDIGQTIPFMFGRTRLKLHFRPCITHT